MIKKKICMLGAFATGKTSLVQRFVRSIFSEKYHTTVGVKIDKKTLMVGDNEIVLILWDLHGKDEFQDIRMSYLRGASGVIYVVDGTRKSTLDVFLNLRKRTRDAVGEVPYILALNKWDLQKEWEIALNTIEDLKNEGISLIETSAKTGQSVEDVFQTLARLMVET